MALANNALYQNENLTLLIINGDYFGFRYLGTTAQFCLTFQQAVDYLHSHHKQVDWTNPRFEIMHRNFFLMSHYSQKNFGYQSLNDNRFVIFLS